MPELVIKMIAVERRLRPLSEPNIEKLMASMRENGLLQPIVVARREGVMPFLVAGANRLEAAKRLGWETIDCVVLDQEDAATVQMVEIAENLHRAELTAEQRDEHIRLYVALVAERQARKVDTVGGTSSPTNDMRRDGRRKAAQHQPGPASIAAAELGISKRHVNRALACDPERPRPEPEPLDDDEVRERQVAAIFAAWNRASPEARDEFVSRSGILNSKG